MISARNLTGKSLSIYYITSVLHWAAADSFPVTLLTRGLSQVMCIPCSWVVSMNLWMRGKKPKHKADGPYNTFCIGQWYIHCPYAVHTGTQIRHTNACWRSFINTSNDFQSCDRTCFWSSFRSEICRDFRLRKEISWLVQYRPEWFHRSAWKPSVDWWRSFQICWSNVFHFLVMTAFWVPLFQRINAMELNGCNLLMSWISYKYTIRSYKTGRMENLLSLGLRLVPYTSTNTFCLSLLQFPSQLKYVCEIYQLDLWSETFTDLILLCGLMPMICWRQKGNSRSQG